jgi:nitrate/nitrite transporter NarK
MATPLDPGMSAPGARADQNVFAPPRSRVTTESVAPRKPLDALLAGFLIACGGTTIGGFLLRLAMLLDWVQQRYDHQQLAIAMRNSIQLIGTLATLAGGYVCARVARRRELELTVALGALALAVMYLTAAADSAALADPRFLAIAFACSMVGGLSGRMRNRMNGTR